MLMCFCIVQLTSGAGRVNAPAHFVDMHCLRQRNAEDFAASICMQAGRQVGSKEDSMAPLLPQ
jgi:hypothetical protein